MERRRIYAKRPNKYSVCFKMCGEFDRKFIQSGLCAQVIKSRVIFGSFVKIDQQNSIMNLIKKQKPYKVLKMHKSCHLMFSLIKTKTKAKCHHHPVSIQKVTHKNSETQIHFCYRIFYSLQ